MLRLKTVPRASSFSEYRHGDWWRQKSLRLPGSMEAGGCHLALMPRSQENEDKHKLKPAPLAAIRVFMLAVSCLMEIIPARPCCMKGFAALSLVVKLLAQGWVRVRGGLGLSEVNMSKSWRFRTDGYNSVTLTWSPADGQSLPIGSSRALTLATPCSGVSLCSSLRMFWHNECDTCGAITGTRLGWINESF